MVVGLVELPPAGRATIRTWPSSLIPSLAGAARIAPPFSLRQAVPHARAPTRSCSPITAAASATRRRPAGRSRGGAGRPRDGPAPLRAGSGRRHEPRAGAEMLDFYGADIMLLIGGGLLEARERLTEATAAFVAEVHRQLPDKADDHRASGRSIARRPTTTAGTAWSSFPTRRTTARCSRRSPGRRCSPIRRCTGSCAISRWRRAASRRWSGTSTCTRC